MTWSIETEKAQIPIKADEGGPITVVLAPGAGSHSEHRTMLWLSDIVRAAGASVVRFDFAYRVQGKSMPDRMPQLMETYAAVLASVRHRLDPQTLVIGGHSMGGRVASMLAAEDPSVCDGLLLFGYPLHPPGQTEKLRDAHLASIKSPTLQFNGTRDTFCEVQIMEAVHAHLPDTYRLEWVEGADHSYSVTKASGRTKQDVEKQLIEAISLWSESAL